MIRESGYHFHLFHRKGNKNLMQKYIAVLKGVVYGYAAPFLPVLPKIKQILPS